MAEGDRRDRRDGGDGGGSDGPEGPTPRRDDGDGDDTITIDASSVCDAASRGDRDGVRSCLLLGDGTRSGAAADALHRSLFGDGDDDDFVDEADRARVGVAAASSKTTDGGAVNAGATCRLVDGEGAVRSRPEHALRALLMLPPWSDPPWRAAEATVLAVQRRRRRGRGHIGDGVFSSRRTGSSCLSEVRMFVASVGRCRGGDEVMHVDETECGVVDDEESRRRRRHRRRRRADPPPGDGATGAAEPSANEESATSTVEEDVLELLLSLALLAVAPYLERRRPGFSSSSSSRPGDGEWQTIGGGVLLPAELLLPTILSASVRLEARLLDDRRRRTGERRSARRRRPLCDVLLSSLFPPPVEDEDEDGGPSGRGRGASSSSSAVVVGSSSSTVQEGGGAEKTAAASILLPPSEGSAGAAAAPAMTTKSGDDADIVHGGVAEMMDADYDGVKEDALNDEADHRHVHVDVDVDVDPELLLPLLSLAVDCAPFLRPGHWESARRSVLSCLHAHHDGGGGGGGGWGEGGSGNGEPGVVGEGGSGSDDGRVRGRGRRHERRRRRLLLPPADYAGLLRQCLGLLSLRLPPPMGGTGRAMMGWEDVIVRVYVGAASLTSSSRSGDGGTAASLATAEALLRSSMSHLPPSSSERLVSHLETSCRFQPPPPPPPPPSSRDVVGGEDDGGVGDVGGGFDGRGVDGGVLTGGGDAEDSVVVVDGRRGRPPRMPTIDDASPSPPPPPWAVANVSLSLLSSTEVPGETHRLAVSALLGGGGGGGGGRGDDNGAGDSIASRLLDALVELPLHCLATEGKEEEGSGGGGPSRRCSDGYTTTMVQEVHESILASSSRRRRPPSSRGARKRRRGRGGNGIPGGPSSAARGGKDDSEGTTSPSVATFAVGEALEDVADALEGAYYAGSGGLVFEGNISKAGRREDRSSSHHRGDGSSGGIDDGADRGRHHHLLSYYARGCACLVWRSIHVGAEGRGRRGTRSLSWEDDGTVARGSLWTNAAWSVLSGGPTRRRSSGPHAYVLAVVALVCVFFEVPASRRSIARGLVSRLTGRRSDDDEWSSCAMTASCFDDDEATRLLLCSVCSVLVSSSVVPGDRDGRCWSEDAWFGRDGTGEDDEHDPRFALGPIADLLTDFCSLAPLPPNVAFRLLRAFLPLASAREKVLSTSRKLLSSSRRCNNVDWGERHGRVASGGGSADPDGMNGVAKRFALDGLVGLIQGGILIDHVGGGGGGGGFGNATTDDEANVHRRPPLDECGHEALSILCDVIVREGRPPLSRSMRTYLFRELSIRAEAEDGGRGRFSRFVSGQLLRASLRRLIQFFVVVVREEEPPRHSSGERDGDGTGIRSSSRVEKTGRAAVTSANLEEMCDRLEFVPGRCLVDWKYNSSNLSRLGSNDGDPAGGGDGVGTRSSTPREDVDGLIRLVVALLASYTLAVSGVCGDRGVDSSTASAGLIRGNLLALVANDDDDRGGNDDLGARGGEKNTCRSMASLEKVGCPDAPLAKEQGVLGGEVMIALGCLKGVLPYLIGEDQQLGDDDGQCSPPKEECFELERVLCTAYQRATIKTQRHTRKAPCQSSVASKARMATLSSTLRSSKLPPPRRVDGWTCADRDLSALKLGLVDAFLGIVLIPNDTDPIRRENEGCDFVPSMGDDLDSCRMILKAVSRLLSSRNNIIMGDPDGGNGASSHHSTAANAAIDLETKKPHRLGEHGDVKLMSAAAFFRLSSRLVGHLHRAPLARCETSPPDCNALPSSEAESLLVAMHYHCGLVNTVLANRQPPKMYPSKQTSAGAMTLAVALWQLYPRTASESAGCYWLDVFERIARDEDGDCRDSERAENVASERVRDMRCMVLRSLSNVLNFLVHSATSGASAWDVLMMSLRDQSIGATEPIQSGPASSLDECMGKVDGAVTRSADCQEPYPAASVSKEHSVILFWFQVSFQLTKDLRCGLDCTSGGMTSVLYKLFLDCIERVLDILSLCPDHIFRQVDAKSLTEVCRETSINLWRILCTYALKHSTLLKRTLRLAIGRIPSFCGHVLPVGAESSSVENHLAVTASRNCLEQLEEWYRVGARDREWIYSGSEDEEEDEDDGGGFDPEAKETEGRSSSTLRLCSAKAWSWAIDVSMTAVCEMWGYKHIMATYMATDAPLTDRLLLPVLHRKKDLSSALVLLCDYLGHLESNGETQVSPICAELLSSSGKIHLCSLIERVALTLRGAIDNLIQRVVFVKKVEHGYSDERKSVSILDGLVCVVALLDPAVDQTLDFAQKTRRWYQVEKWRNSLTKMKANCEHYVEDEPIVGRLPRALFKIQRFESSLQRLLVVTRQHQEHIRQYDPLIRRLLVNSESVELNSRSIDLLSCLVERFVARNAAQSTLGMASIMNSKEEREEYDYATGPNHWNGDKPSKKAQNDGSDSLSRRRKARRLIQRSRNETIDEWLGLDATCNENSDVDDAFADLEDFLVPG